MENLTRPNGKTYRPRTPPRAETFYTWDERSAVVVIGTHDLEVAAGLAQRLWDYDEPLPEGRTHWWRLIPWNASGMFDRSWVDAPERGRPVVVFTPTEV